MNRRAFIGRTLLAAGAACLPWPASGESPYLEDHSHNWWAWRESLKRVLEETGHRFRCAELERPIGGFRRARVHDKRDRCRRNGHCGPNLGVGTVLMNKDFAAFAATRAVIEPRPRFRAKLAETFLVRRLFSLRVRHSYDSRYIIQQTNNHALDGE